MGAARIAAASVVVGGIVSLVTGLPAGSASADSTTVPGVLSTVSQRTGPITLVVPPGTTPAAVTGVLSMPEVVDGAVIAVLVNGRLAAQVPSTLYTKVTIPVTAADVLADATMALTLRYDAPPGTTGCAPPPEITLRKLGLDYTGLETPPTSASTFFPAQASRIDVKVPPDTSDDVLQAALNAVASLSARYPTDTPVELSTSDQPLATTGAGQRVVSLVGSPTDVSTSITSDFGVPTLLLSGAGLPLSEAANALGADVLALAGSSETAGLSSRPVRREDRPTHTLDELRQDAPLSTDPAPGSVETEIRQDSFGGPVSSLAIHLEGTHSAVAVGAEARLDVYLDDELVQSSAIDADPRIDLDVTVPSSRLRSTNTLRVTLSSAAAPAPATDPTTAAPAACSPGLPLELALDGEQSTVTASRGTGDLSGFQLFPQGLEARLPVAIRQDGTSRIDGAIDAARVIGALQRQASGPLDVTVVDADEFLAGDRSGLLVGADDVDSVSVGTPLRLSGTRLLSTEEERFQVSSDAPFAALQAVSNAGRSVLVFGSWAPGDTVAVPSLSHRLTERLSEDGWGVLDGDVLVLDSGGPPYTVDSGTTLSPAEPVVQERSVLPYVLVGVGVVLALLVLVLVLVLRAVRRSRRPATPRWADDPGPADDIDDDIDGDDDGSEVSPEAAAVAVTLSRSRQPWVKLRRD